MYWRKCENVFFQNGEIFGLEKIFLFLVFHLLLRESLVHTVYNRPQENVVFYILTFSWKNNIFLEMRKCENVKNMHLTTLVETIQFLRFNFNHDFFFAKGSVKFFFCIDHSWVLDTRVSKWEGLGKNIFLMNNKSLKFYFIHQRVKVHFFNIFAFLENVFLQENVFLNILTFSCVWENVKMYFFKTVKFFVWKKYFWFWLYYL